MSAASRRAPVRWLDDIATAIEAIRSHLQRGDLGEGIVYDAVRMRTLEIGEAVKSLPTEMLAQEPAIPWRELRSTRDRLAHRYFMDDVQYLRATVVTDLDVIEAAVRRMRSRLAGGGDIAPPRQGDDGRRIE